MTNEINNINVLIVIVLGNLFSSQDSGMNEYLNKSNCEQRKFKTSTTSTLLNKGNEQTMLYIFSSVYYLV